MGTQSVRLPLKGCRPIKLGHYRRQIPRWRAPSLKTAATPTQDPRIVEPQYHAERLHALIISLRNLDDTPLILADEEQVNIRDWLVYMASDESRLLMRCLGFNVNIGEG
jgi:hypothetical protein